jgi:transposase InsO family protein
LLELNTKGPIQSLVLALSEGKITTRSIRNYFRCSLPKWKSYIQSLGIDYPDINSGRPHVHIPPTTTSLIMKLTERFRVGYHRAAETIRKVHQINISDYQVSIIFEQEGLFKYEREYNPSKIHDLRFVAKYANQLWHTDLHYWDAVKIGELSHQTYVIAFIDDRTRKIISAEVLHEKTSEAAAEALLKTLRDNQKPSMITIDNGGEFIGESFQTILALFQIKQQRTHPRTPQENGKMERWWHTLEESLINHEYLQEFIYYYNNVWIHQGISRYSARPMTPQDLWNSEIHYEGMSDLEIIDE